MYRLLPLIGLWCLIAAAQDDVGRELATNGSFELDANADGVPDGFSASARTVKLVTEGGQRFVRIGTAGGPPVDGSLSRALQLDPDWFKLRVAARVRVQDVVLGKESWHNARIAMSFHDPAGTQVGGWPNVLNWVGSTDGWVAAERVYVIPEGAKELRISCSLFSASGQVDYDDFSVTVVSHRPKLEDGRLPAGVVAAWDLASAWREETPTRGRVCLNGLWRCRPVWEAEAPPAAPGDGQGWGYLKVPAVWPGRGMEATRPIGPDIWDLNVNWAKVEQAWYQRDVTVPAEWTGRKLFISFDLPQTEAVVWLGGRRIGAARWPAGRVEVTDLLRPGTTTRLTVQVTTDPLERERMVAMREDLVEKIKADVRFRGLVGDVFLVSEPAATRLGEVQTQPSVRRKALALVAEVQGLAAGGRYRLDAVAQREGREAWRGRGRAFTAAEAQDGRVRVEWPWPDPQLWDFEQPNLYDLSVSLVNEADQQVIDTVPTRFGFRELWLDGRNLMLNGTPVHLRALDFMAPTSNEATVSLAATKAWLQRARETGFNFVIFSNYGLDPGGTNSFTDILRAADEIGFAVSFSLPHVFRTVGAQNQGLDPLWQSAARYAVATAGNHPCVLAYAANHNSLGYYGDQNPAKMDGIHVQNPDGARFDYFRNNRRRAAEGEAFVRALDPTRELYHHQSGHMGAWHTVNIYLCWSPIQERSEWLSHWATQGVKPLFFVEWGPPHQASWGGHRQGPFIWRNNVNSEPLGIEYGAMLFGDAAYRPDPVMERYVDAYEQVYARRQPFHISSVLGTLWSSSNELNNIDLKTKYTDVVWPRLRTFGITAILPWDQGMIYTADRGEPAAELPTDWAKLQRPGHAPDLSPAGGSPNLSSWGRSFQRWNMPLCAYLAGDPARFTERGHNVRAGETLTKQVILVNDRRQAVSGTFRWRLSLGRAPVAEGQGQLRAPAGGVDRQAFRVPIPATAKGELTLSARINVGGEEQVDALPLHVVEAAAPAVGRLAVFDPRGLTTAALRQARVTATAVQASTPLTGFEALLIGREAIGPDNPLPDLRPLLVRGGRVLVMEQTEDALTRRLGFRCNDPSLRETFVRVAEHPVLAGLDTARLTDWRGESSLTPPAMDLPANELSDPPKDWLGFANTRVWKWGNAGQVATVVIEKPQRGDFTSLVEGGFDLQYAPLLLHRANGGEVLFCQMDVTSRRGDDPAAQRLWANLLSWTAGRAAATPPAAAYLGDDPGAKLLSDLSVSFTRVAANRLPRTGTLVVGPGAGAQLAPAKDALAAAVEGGLTVVALSQTAASLAGWLPFQPVTREEARTCSPVPAGQAFTGLGPGDLRWRGRRNVLLVGGPNVEPNVVNEVPHGRGRFVFCQVLPTDWDWRDEYRVYLKPTARRTAILLSRLLANCGVPAESPVLPLWGKPTPVAMDLAGEWQVAVDRENRFTPASLPADPAWRPVAVPGTFEAALPDLAGYDGVVWYRKTITWPGPQEEPVRLLLGAVDDEEWTFVNGQPVGHVGQDTNPTDYWSARREYELPAGTLRPGANTLLVKVRDLRQSGGLVGPKLSLVAPARWLATGYLDEPAQLDDPYRYNRW